MEDKCFSKETAFRTLELINSWINNVDTKVSFSLAFSTTILGLIFYNAGSEPKALQEFKIAYAEKSISFFNWSSVAILFLMYVSFLIVLICFFLSLRGKVVNSNKGKSVFFFGTIADYSMNNYKVIIKLSVPDGIAGKIKLRKGCKFEDGSTELPIGSGVFTVIK